MQIAVISFLGYNNSIIKKQERKKENGIYCRSNRICKPWL